MNVVGTVCCTWTQRHEKERTTRRNERWTTGSEKRASPSSLSVILTSVVHYRGGTTPYKYIYSCECALLPLLPICLCGRAGDRGSDYKNEETLSMTWSSKISRRTFLEISSSTSFSRQQGIRQAIMTSNDHFSVVTWYFLWHISQLLLTKIIVKGKNLLFVNFVQSEWV